MKFNIEPNIGNKPFESKAELIANKFTKWIVDKKIDTEILNSEEAIMKCLSDSRLLLRMPDVELKKVMEVLKKTGIIYVPASSKKVDTPLKTEIFKTGSEVLKGVTKIEDENVVKQLKENKFFESLEKDIFTNPKDLDSIHEKALSLGKENYIEKEETIDLYNEFADKGLLKGGRVEAEKDFQRMIGYEKKYQEEKELLEKEKADNLDKTKKVATIMECGVAYGITNLDWYGSHFSMENVCKFVDYRNHTDKLLEVRKGEDESNFLGLGIDVTYRGLYSEKYKEKLFKLLGSIQDGYKTKIKYFKNHKGEMMKEFAVPSIILSFNIEDVKDMVNYIKNIDDPKIKEEFKNSPQKFTVMNQMIIQCEILSTFAEKYQNNIFRKYIDIVSTIKELAWGNPEIKKILDARHEDEVSIHMKYLIKEFENNQKQN